jgi:hypothetical protein
VQGHQQDRREADKHAAEKRLEWREVRHRAIFP